MSSNRSPERAVTEIGVSCSDSAVLRAVTTTSSRAALATDGRIESDREASNETDHFLSEAVD